MKKMTMLVSGVLLASVVSVLAAFTPPSAQQLSAAANDPALVSALMKDASAEQAAQVLKALIVKISGLGLESQAASARITAVVNGGFSAVPAGSVVLLASELGTLAGKTSSISGNPTLVSTIQNAIATAGGRSGAALASGFGSAYTAAREQSSSDTNNKYSAPPFGRPYPGQR
jgi:hypothetical protein